MAIEYYEFGRQLDFWDIDSSMEIQSTAGVVINVQGEIDYFLDKETGIGALCDLYTICLDPGEAVSLNLKKTTTQSSSSVKMGLFNYNYALDEKEIRANLEKGKVKYSD